MTTKQFKKILHTISYDRHNRVRVFIELQPDEQSSILFRLNRHVQYQLVIELSDEQLVAILEHLDPDEATDILQLLNNKRQKAIVSNLNEHLQKSVAILLHFDPETAAGLMNVDYIQVELDDTIGSVAKQVKIHEKRTGKLPTILVVKEGKLVGQLPGHELGFAHAGDVVNRYLKKIKSIPHNARYKQVLAIFRQYPHNKVVVVGERKQILGVIYTDDILKLIQGHEAASLYDFAGVSDEESIYDSIPRKFRFRYKWLIINLGTAFLAAFTVGLFDATISKHVLLAVYMPIVAGMGGNAATQTLAVMVRGLSQSDLGFSTIFNTLKNEIASGIINGIINGIIVTLIVYVFNDNLLVGLVLGFAMVVNLFIAGLFGTLVPVAMKKLGKDPASSATIFITTATDVFGFLAFLGLATMILG